MMRQLQIMKLDAVNEDATVTVTDGTSDVLHGDTDADSDTLTVTQIAVTVDQIQV